MVISEITTTQEALKAVQKEGSALQYVSEHLKTPELCLAAVQNSYLSVLKFVPHDLKTPELCLAAVQKNGYNLADVPEDLRTAEMCLEAAKSMHEMDDDLEEAIKEIEGLGVS